MTISTTYQRAKLFSFTLALIVLSSQLLLAAGSGTIKGRIIDKSTGELLTGANAIVVNTSLGAASDLDGKIAIYSVPAGEQKLKVSYIGYVTITVDITVVENETVEQDYQLEPQALTGETVVITAQARGQLEAINQQLSSNTISNIVASDRIKELPDVSAAESIGRLPGINIERYNGEATGVGIRGLSPKYNTVSVNGVALPATDRDNRSVDLSLISSNLLDGIEVKKANTPDMDADALGGTIDLRLKEAPEGLQLDAGLQGGYNNRQDFYGNYSGYLNVSKRLFDNKLGIIAGINFDRNNRAADKLNADYRDISGSGSTASEIWVDRYLLRREDAFKKRLGGNLLVDYKISKGKVVGNFFYNKAETDGTSRQSQQDFRENKHYYLMESNLSTMSVYTSSIGIEQDYGWIKYDASIAAAGSQLDEPNVYQWQFNQESASQTGIPTAETPLDEVYKLITVRDSTTYLRQVYDFKRRLNERTKALQFNFQVPIKITDKISGYIKSGAKFRWIDRNFDQEQWGRTAMSDGDFLTNVRNVLIRGLAARYPSSDPKKGYDWLYDSASCANTRGWYSLARFNTGYAPPSNFMDGQYKLGTFPDMELMKKMMDVFPTLGASFWQRFSIGSLGSDYEGVEQYQAGYIMSELNCGRYVTITPGVRYDADYTRYKGQSFKAVNTGGYAEGAPVGLRKNENERKNFFWLPMLHIRIQPAEWLRIHLASTETVTRPDYIQYAPITSLDAFGGTLQGANGSLKDARSRNLDASISIHEAHIGLITVSGFYKKIDNLIMFTQIRGVNLDVYGLLYESGLLNLNAPQNWFANSPDVNTYINNPTFAQYRGVELDWQTNFWYLPSVFKGLIFNLNWTYITSEIDLHMWSPYVVKVEYIPADDGWKTTYGTRHTTRMSRMPGQPAHLFNMTIGYDIKGFSIRASYLYQSDKFTGSGTTSSRLTDFYTDNYGRWDIAVQQKITKNIQVYANLNNLNDSYDRALIGDRLANPQHIEYYGRTIDAGVRFKL